MSDIWLNTADDVFVDTGDDLWVDVVSVSDPVILPISGTYPPAQLISIDVLDPPTASVHFTLDGSTPTELSTLYEGPFALVSAKTVKAIGINPGYIDSEIASETYTLGIPYPVTITIADQIGDAEIYYTVDGTDPDRFSELYSAPFDVESPVIEIRSFATHPEYRDSDIASEVLS